MPSSAFDPRPEAAYDDVVQEAFHPSVPTPVALGLLILVAGGACSFDARNPSITSPAAAMTEPERAGDTASSSPTDVLPAAESELGPDVTELALTDPSQASAEPAEPPAPAESMEAADPAEPPTPARPTCSSAAAFEAPIRVPGLPDRAVRLRTSPDERIGYYALPSTTSSYDLFVTTRGTRTSAFGTAESLAFNDAAWDFSPTLPGDGTILYLESNRSGSWKLYQSEWDPEAEAFGPLAFAPGLSSATTTSSDGSPYVTTDGAALYFHTTRQGRQLLASARRSGASFGPVVLIDTGDLGVAGTPIVAPDELTLYFAVQAGSEATGRHIDVWSATRSSTSAAFEDFRELSGVNTPANELPSFISEDGCRLYFDRNTGFPFGWGRDDDAAYVAERPLQE